MAMDLSSILHSSSNSSGDSCTNYSAFMSYTGMETFQPQNAHPVEVSMLTSLWNWIEYLWMWPWDLTHYPYGVILVYLIGMLIVVCTEEEQITLFTPFKCLSHIFSDHGGAVAFIAMAWGPLICVIIPLGLLIFLLTWGKDEALKEDGWARRTRLWMESKVIYDIKGDKVR